MRRSALDLAAAEDAVRGGAFEARVSFFGRLASTFLVAEPSSGTTMTFLIGWAAPLAVDSLPGSANRLDEDETWRSGSDHGTAIVGGPSPW